MQVFLRDAILQALLEFAPFVQMEAGSLLEHETAMNLLEHARTIYTTPLLEIMKEYRQLLEPEAEALGRFRTLTDRSRATARAWDASDWQTAAFVALIKNEFRRFSTLEYVDGNLVVSHAKPVKPPQEFFGYDLTKRDLVDYFSSFAAGIPARPLLLDGPPGIGKTELVISYALANRLQIVIASPRELTTFLGPLLQKLGRMPRRIVLFYDDLDPEAVDWHHFRQFVSGTARYPNNVAMALVTNKKFPENVLSRGNYIEIPPFSYDVARSMIAGYLEHIENRNPHMIERLGVGYLLAFGQEKIVEMSPRSLIIYLDAVTAKRMKVLSGPGQRFTEELFDDAYSRHVAMGKSPSRHTTPGMTGSL
jgi:predicted AAA+ superfamily ATPase